VDFRDDGTIRDPVARCANTWVRVDPRGRLWGRARQFARAKLHGIIRRGASGGVVSGRDRM